MDNSGAKWYSYQPAPGGGERTGKEEGKPAVFLGEYQHSVDDKGRMVLPSRFRNGMADGCVVTKGQERCLYVFPMARWQEEVERFRSLPRTDARARRLTRSFFAGAISQELDANGRVQLPPGLRDYAGLGKEVTVIGVSDRVEIWNTAEWTDYTAAADEFYSNIEEALYDAGI